MLSLFKKILLLTLAILQMFAPLVHAHTGMSNRIGFHLPGLESFVKIKNAAVFDTIQSLTHEEGLVIAVDTGIKSPMATTVAKQPVEQVFAIVNLELKIQAISVYHHNFSPHTFFLSSQQKIDLPQSPRAPPVLNI